jgi:hypothetical protein
VFWKISAVGRLLGPIPAMFWPPIFTAPSRRLQEAETVRRIVVLPPEAEKRKELAALDIEGSVVDCGKFPESDRDVIEFDTRTHLPRPVKIFCWSRLVNFPRKRGGDQAGSKGPKRVSPGEPGLTTSFALFLIRRR